MDHLNPQRPPWKWIGIGLLCISVLLILSLRNRGGFFSFSHTEEPLVVISTGTVHAGDELSTILIGKGLKRQMVTNVESAFSKMYNLRLLKPGHTFEVITSTDGIFKQFLYHTDPINTYAVSLSTEGIFSQNKNQQKTVWMKKFVSGEVTESMYKSLLKQGYDRNFVDNLIVDVADNIFAWRIDFFTEQRPGDKYSVMMEQEFIVGSSTPLWNGRGKVLAASYIGKGTKRKENFAIRYQAPLADRADYYDLEGQAVRKAFLRAPFTQVNFRISSGYSSHRFHPILRVYRPHHGTDYAASIGTPVSSVGKGVVIFAGVKGGYGKCVEIRHNSKYVSRYGHLSRIGVRQGASVSQGGSIGNVGNSGLSTGPHLHFEMIVDGVSRNFLAMEFPAASAVSKANMTDFNAVRDRLIAELNAGPLASDKPSSTARSSAARATH